MITVSNYHVVMFQVKSYIRSTDSFVPFTQYSDDSREDHIYCILGPAPSTSMRSCVCTASGARAECRPR